MLGTIVKQYKVYMKGSEGGGCGNFQNGHGWSRRRGKGGHNFLWSLSLWTAPNNEFALKFSIFQNVFEWVRVYQFFFSNLVFYTAKFSHFLITKC